jgi:hypothetical protein
MLLSPVGGAYNAFDTWIEKTFPLAMFPDTGM